MVRDTISIYQDVARKGAYKSGDRNFNVSYDPKSPYDQKLISNFLYKLQDKV